MFVLIGQMSLVSELSSHEFLHVNHVKFIGRHLKDSSTPAAVNGDVSNGKVLSLVDGGVLEVEGVPASTTVNQDAHLRGPLIRSSP